MFEGVGRCTFWPEEPGSYCEDDYVLDPGLGVAVLSHGRGAIGMQGKPAARIAAWSVVGELERASADEGPRALRAGHRRANDAVRRLSFGWPEGLQKPMTALAVVWVTGPTAMMLNAGDTRIVRARRGTIDVLMGGEPPICSGLPSLASAATMLGLRDDVEPMLETVDVEPGDVFALAPRSLFERLSDAELRAMLGAHDLGSELGSRLERMREASPYGSAAVCIIRIGGSQERRASSGPRPATSWLFDPGRPLADPPRRYVQGPDPTWFTEIFSLVLGSEAGT